MDAALLDLSPEEPGRLEAGRLDRPLPRPSRPKEHPAALALLHRRPQVGSRDNSAGARRFLPHLYGRRPRHPDPRWAGPAPRASPDRAFLTWELVCECFPDIDRIERKHEVSTLRAARKIAAADPDWRSWRTNEGSVFFNYGNLQSYALARMFDRALEAALL
jgi:hypothetical protein